MQKKYKICFFLAGLVSGGLENYLLRFVKYCPEDVDICVVAKLGIVGDLDSAYADCGARVVHLKQALFSFFDFLQLWKFLKEEKPDVVCDFSGNFGARSLFAAWLTGVRTRIASHRGASNHFQETPARLFINALLNKAIELFSTSIIANSYAALNFFHPKWKENAKKFHVIYNGMDLSLKRDDTLRACRRKALKLPDAAFLVGHTGSLISGSGDVRSPKNHRTIIEVAVRLCHEHPDIYFVLCGKGVDTIYRERICRENLQDRIILPGLCSPVTDYLCAMDAYYFPSISEGQPNALIEAMFCGLPIVASNIEPIQETIPPGLREELIPPCDIDSACEKILKLKNDSVYRQKMTCVEWSRNFFDPEKRYGEFLDVLRDQIR